MYAWMHNVCTDGWMQACERIASPSPKADSVPHGSHSYAPERMASSNTDPPKHSTPPLPSKVTPPIFQFSVCNNLFCKNLSLPSSPASSD